MSTSINLIRMTFFFLSIFFFTAHTVTLEGGISVINVVTGVAIGSFLGILLIAIDKSLKKFTLRNLNILTIGFGFGYLLGTAIIVLLNASLDLTNLSLTSKELSLFKTAIYISSCYLATILTFRGAEEFHVSIPFVKFKASNNKKKDILIDASILLDSRVIDLAVSGLLDKHLIMPKFTLKELYLQSESSDENIKAKARRSLEVCKKLESISNLEMRFSDTDFPEIKDPIAKLVRLARLLDTNIITADISRIQQSSIEGIVVINIHALSNALKPLTQSGEHINIKIQRYGKEPRQGVGYLEDGTMVVVNGGAEHIGETIKAQVLSVKHTSSGRMIFCNSTDENLITEHESETTLSLLDNSHKNYFAIDSSKYTQ